MKRARVLSAAFALIFIGAATQMHAQGRGRGRGEAQARPPVQVPQAEQDRGAKEEQQRAEQYKRALDQQVVVVQRQAAQLDAQKRAAQLRAQQLYVEQTPPAASAGAGSARLQE